MKIGKFAALGILTVALTASGTFTRASNFRAQVPFAFVVGNQTLPPGTYIVQRLLGKILDSTGVVVIKTSDHRIYCAVITRLRADRLTDRVKVSKLRFTIFKGQQYLSQICVAGDGLADHLSTPADSASLDGLPVREVKLISLH
ncbi:MAG: hypothetical protein WAL32_08225 [Terriglobales bacterium]